MSAVCQAVSWDLGMAGGKKRPPTLLDPPMNIAVHGGVVGDPEKTKLGRRRGQERQQGRVRVR